MNMKPNKIKTEVKNNATFLTIKSAKGQVLNPTEVEAITKGRVDSLLPLEVKESGKSFKLIYNVSGMKSLGEYLRETQMNKQLFGFLLQNIFNMLQTLEATYFSTKSVLLTFGKIKVEPSSRRLYFIYVPIQYYNNDVDIKEFLLSLIDRITFSQNEDLSYVQQYLQILNTGVNFSLFDLEQYINELSGNVKVQEKKKCPHCEQMVPADANFCGNCQYSFIKKGVTGPTKSETSVYDPLKYSKTNDVVEEHDWKYVDEEENENLNGHTDDIGTSVLGKEIFDDEGPGTVVLTQEKQIIKAGYLFRTSNGEKKEINKTYYSVGKSLQNDFSVPDNKAVSRQHILIIKKGDKYYINDQNSTNRTYINGNVIAPKTDVEITTGSKLRLANEDFIFEIQTKEV